jgi:hypothetical protein
MNDGELHTFVLAHPPLITTAMVRASTAGGSTRITAYHLEPRKQAVCCCLHLNCTSVEMGSRYPTMIRDKHVHHVVNAARHVVDMLEGQADLSEPMGEWTNSSWISCTYRNGLYPSPRNALVCCLSLPDSVAWIPQLC